MFRVRSHRVEPECCPPVSQDPGPKGSLAAALGAEELEGLSLRAQEEGAPAAIQVTEILRHWVQVGQAGYLLPRLPPLPPSQPRQLMSPHLRPPSLRLFRLRRELHQRRRQLLP